MDSKAGVFCGSINTPRRHGKTTIYADQHALIALLTIDEQQRENEKEGYAADKSAHART